MNRVLCFLLLFRTFFTAFRFVDTVLCFHLGGMLMRVASMGWLVGFQVHRRIIGFGFPGFLDYGRYTDLEPETCLFFLSPLSMSTALLFIITDKIIIQPYEQRPSECWRRLNISITTTVPIRICLVLWLFNLPTLFSLTAMIVW